MKTLWSGCCILFCLLFLSACKTPPARLAGLTAQWSAENSVTESLNDLPAKVVGNVTFADGVFGKAFQFDGGSLLAVDGSRAAARFSGPFTVEAWVNYELMGGDSDTIVSKGDQQGGPVDWALSVSVNSHFRPHVFTDVGGWHYFDCRTPLLPHQWYHVAMTYDGEQLRGYVNGVEDGAVAITGKVRATNGDLRIGGYAPFPGKTGFAFFNGRVDELSLYDRALTGAEIQARAKSGR